MNNDMKREALKGGIFGMIASGTAFYALDQLSADFRGISKRFKTGVVLSAGVLCALLAADSARSTLAKSKGPVHISPSVLYPHPLDEPVHKSNDNQPTTTSTTPIMQKDN